jgi:hypothetical protein
MERIHVAATIPITRERGWSSMGCASKESSQLTVSPLFEERSEWRDDFIVIGPRETRELYSVYSFLTF